MKRVMLYFGSFNPIHRGHIALAEYAIEQNLCDDLIMIVSPQNPLKESSELAPELERFTMAELACGGSKYPDNIKASVIEFMLPKPSYTINTLQHLTTEYGSAMSFSILVGGDIIEQFEKWHDYQKILDNYPIFVYPRTGERVEKYLDRITLLQDAPALDVSSTGVRLALMRGEDTSNMIAPEVAKHIKEQGFWSEESYFELLSKKIEDEPENIEHYIERAKWHYKRNGWGEALNDFNRALKLEPDNKVANEMAKMAHEILEFRYTDIYNP